MKLALNIRYTRHIGLKRACRLLLADETSPVECTSISSSYTANNPPANGRIRKKFQLLQNHFRLRSFNATSTFYNHRRPLTPTTVMRVSFYNAIAPKQLQAIKTAMHSYPRLSVTYPRMRLTRKILHDAESVRPSRSPPSSTAVACALHIIPHSDPIAL